MSTVLLDSDAFIAWLIVPDGHHGRVVATLERLTRQSVNLTTTSYVVAETATLLSRRYAQAQARRFVQMLHDTDFPIIEIVADLRREAERLFLQQMTEKVSLIDCANVVAARQMNTPAIVSFDHFYLRCGIHLME